jgi:integrase
MPKLTATYVEKMKPPVSRIEVPDAVLPGFYLVLQPSGHKSYAIRYRHAGRTRKLTLGTTAVLPLALARERGREALQAVAAGRDPAIERKEARAGHHDLVRHVAAQFVERHVRKLRPESVASAERMVNSYIVPAIGNRRIQAVTRRDIVELLDGILDAGKPVTANRALAVANKLFNWAVERSIIETSPCIGVKRPAVEQSRDRVLSDDELAIVWQAAELLEHPAGAFVKLLALLGQRRNEIAGMRWSEITGPLWTLPAQRTKNKRVHEVPLPQAAQAILASIPRIAGSDFVLTVSGAVPFAGFAPAKERLDELAPIAERWTFHDLRRTLASGMARLGRPIHVIEAVLNHKSGTVSGITAVYQRHTFSDEKRAALEVWAQHVLTLAGQ